MGKALELVTVSATAPGGGGAAQAALVGNTLTVRQGSGIQLLASGGKRQTNGIQRLSSSLLHDSTVGMKSTIGASVAKNFWHKPAQDLETQDVLLAFCTGSATAGQFEMGTYLIWYQDLLGSDGRYIDRASCNRRGVNLFQKQVTCVGTGAGGYTGSVAINAADDVFKANTDYAILGVSGPIATFCASIRLTGPDWGAVSPGLPYITESPDLMADFFPLLSDISNLPTIPVLSASNRGVTTVAIACDQAGTTLAFSLMLLELRRPKA